MHDSSTPRYVLHDLVEQPDFNPATQNNRGDWSLRDVSQGSVFPDPASGKPCCQTHGAMNCVVPDMSLWRCLMCGRAAYVTHYDRPTQVAIDAVHPYRAGA